MPYLRLIFGAVIAFELNKIGTQNIKDHKMFWMNQRINIVNQQEAVLIRIATWKTNKYE